MPQSISPDALTGVWSAAPTPLTEKMTVHTGDIKRMVEHHIRLGVRGLFLCGTNGEGPWLPESEKRTLVKETVAVNTGQLLIAVQVTDNSSARIIDNMNAAAKDGADIAVIAPPNFFYNVSPATLEKHYVRAIEASPLPVGIYDRGKFGPVTVPAEVLANVLMHEKVIMLKDSSTMPENREAALKARERRPDLRLLDGDEFNCVDYLKAGYDGLLLGGGVFNGYLAGMIFDAVKSGRIPQALELQQRMNDMMYAVYGGRDISCWLAGEKRLLMELGVLSTTRNFPEYSVSVSCLAAIREVLDKDRDILLP